MVTKGFFGSLFDMSFTEFVTTRIIKVLFVLAIIVSVIISIALFIGCLQSGAPGILLGLVIAPLAFLLYVIVARVWLEVVIVLFRIAENTGRLVEQGKKAGGNPPEATV